MSLPPILPERNSSGLRLIGFLLLATAIVLSMVFGVALYFALYLPPPLPWAEVGQDFMLAIKPANDPGGGNKEISDMMSEFEGRL